MLYIKYLVIAKSQIYATSSISPGVPLILLRFRCSSCSSDRTDWVISPAKVMKRMPKPPRVSRVR